MITKEIHRSKELLDSIVCTDCIEGMERIKDKTVDLVLADPPYGISRELNCKNQRLGSTAKLNFNFGEWDIANEKWINIAIRKTNGWFITFCAKKDIGFYWNILEENDFIAIDALVWQKPDPLPLNAKSRFLNAWESLVVGKRSGAFWGSNYFHNILKYQSPKNSERVHPTQKPLGLITRLIELTTQENDIVLDPFIGSGTTAIACKMLKRHFIGFEKSEKYCEIANNRIADFDNGNLFK